MKAMIDFCALGRPHVAHAQTHFVFSPAGETGGWIDALNR